MRFPGPSWTRPRVWHRGKDAGWMFLMGVVCLGTYVISSFLLKHTHWIRS